MLLRKLYYIKSINKIENNEVFETHLHSLIGKTLLPNFSGSKKKHPCHPDMLTFDSELVQYQCQNLNCKINLLGLKV